MTAEQQTTFHLKVKVVLNALQEQQKHALLLNHVMEHKHAQQQDSGKTATTTQTTTAQY